MRKESFIWSIGECRVKSEMANNAHERLTGRTCFAPLGLIFFLLVF